MPTIATKNAHIDTLSRSVAKSQGRERDLKHELRDAERAIKTLTEQLADARRIARGAQDHAALQESRADSYRTILVATNSELLAEREEVGRVRNSLCGRIAAWWSGR